MDDLGRSYLGIKEWYIPAKDSSDIEVDIVCVHGFAANPFWTWVGRPKIKDTKSTATINTSRRGEGCSVADEKGSVLWLKDFLPSYVPTARIATFGYQSNYLKKAPKRDIENCAQELLSALVQWRLSTEEKTRPIIFLGHSFGGIVIKEALIKATLAAKEFECIREFTRGIIFLGTPHRGTSIASYGDMLVAMTKAVGLGSDRELIHSLRNRSPELFKVATYFSDIYDHFEIFCFYELEPWKFSSVVVEHASAVIEGRPNAGLTVNHSGLNKYASADDPNMIKIAQVAADMVKSTGRKNEATKENLVKRRPWETTALLVGQIDTMFDIRIKTMDLRYALRSDIDKMVIQRYRFQSWAYTLGLIPMLKARQPLHFRLHEIEVSNAVCAILQQVVLVIDVDRSRQQTTAVGLNDHDVVSDVKVLFRQLVSWFVDEDRNIMRNVLINRMLGLKSAEDDKSEYSTLEDVSLSDDYADLDATAALKRIRFLSEQSESRRVSENKLIIPFHCLDLDKTRSASRSTGTLISQDLDGRVSRKVIVEWKQYEGYWDTEIGNELFHRVELLAEFLKSASKYSELMDLRLLDCLGYCHDDQKKRLGFISNIPKSVDARSAPIRLSSLLKEYNDRKLSPPPVGDRMELAKMLCKAMFGFHRAEWFHKSFSSFNILYFSDAQSLDSPDLEDVEVGDYSILLPYVMGFNNSRPSKPNEFSDPARLSNEALRYWHPEYKNTPMQKYRHEFDYYSLGIVMLEVGLWSPLSTLTRNMAKLEALEFALKVRDSLLPLLRSSIGLVYEGVVSDLLDAADELGDKADRNNLSSLGQLIQFQTQVQKSLGQCRA